MSSVRPPELDRLAAACAASDYAGVLPGLSHLATKHPSHPEVIYHLGVAQNRLERFKDAERTLKKAIRLAPKAVVRNIAGAGALRLAGIGRAVAGAGTRLGASGALTAADGERRRRWRALTPAVVGSIGWLGRDRQALVIGVRAAV